MIYDELGQIRFKGVTDSEDSPVAAACAALFTGQEVNPFNYFKELGRLDCYQRCYNSKYTFSRDQFVSLAAVLFTKGYYSLVSEQMVDGKDVMWGIGSHIRICQGKKPFFYQTWIFKLSLWWSAKFQPFEELNQLFFQLMVHPDQSLITWYCGMNPYWSLAIRKYFCNWREEQELAELMINKIKERIKLD